MNTFSNRSLTKEADELFEKVQPVLLSTFCAGIQQSKLYDIVRVSIVLLFINVPFSLLLSCALKFPYYIIAIVFWLVFAAELQGLGINLALYIGLSLLLVNGESISTEVAISVGYMVNILTFGMALKLLCAKYQAGQSFSEQLLSSDALAVPITALLGATPLKYRNKYDSLIELYNAAVKTGNQIPLLDAIGSSERTARA